VIGYPSRQDGAILPARDYTPCPARKVPPKPYKNSFIDQACAVKMDGHLHHSFLASLSTSKKKITWPISSHHDLTLSLINNPYYCPMRKRFFLLA